MSYSFDVIKKMAFEKEIEHIKSRYNTLEEREELKKLIIDYMTGRIKEIDELYGEEPIRD